MMDTLYIVMPAYNEEENIESVVNDWYPILEMGGDDSRLVIADAGSTDKTHEKLLGLQNKLHKLIVLETENQFHGPKLIALYKYAIDNKAQYVFQTDSDGQTNPKEFKAFWDLRKEYDGIFGNRTVRGDGKDRAFVEKVVCFLLRLYFGVNVPDANAPFRLLNEEVLGKYIHRLPKDYNLPNIMICTYYAFFNEKHVFKEISFKPRQAGINSINIKKIIAIGWKALGDFYVFRKDIIR